MHPEKPLSNSHKEVVADKTITKKELQIIYSSDDPLIGKLEAIGKSRNAAVIKMNVNEEATNPRLIIEAIQNVDEKASEVAGDGYNVKDLVKELSQNGKRKFDQGFLKYPIVTFDDKTKLVSSAEELNNW